MPAIFLIAWKLLAGPVLDFLKAMPKEVWYAVIAVGLLAGSHWHGSNQGEARAEARHQAVLAAAMKQRDEQQAKAVVEAKEAAELFAKGVADRKAADVTRQTKLAAAIAAQARAQQCDDPAEITQDLNEIIKQGTQQ